MVPADRLPVCVVGTEAIPRWFGAADQPWLRALVDEVARMDGRPARELRARLAEPLPVSSPAGPRALAAAVLTARLGRADAGADARSVRAALFAAAQRARDAGRVDRARAVEEAARVLGLSTEVVERALFADLPGERRVVVPSVLPGAAELASACNLALAQGLLRVASRVRISLRGNARPVVRQVVLRRLLCLTRSIDDGVALDVSGPFALFRHTILYGRALASLLPVLAWCDRFEVRARCLLRGAEHEVVLRSGDPLPPSPEPLRWDSHVERLFARDVAKAAPEWDVVREPEVIRLSDRLLFPDFALVHRRDPRLRWVVEIVGFWTSSYLRSKLDAYGRAGLRNLILCIDEQRRCDAGSVPAGARVLWYRRRIDASAICRILAEPRT